MASHNYFIYIVTNPNRTTLYIGVTNDLARRIEEHALNAGNPSTFAGKYFCHNLIYYERFTYIEHAIEREKELKKWSRSKKESLIEIINPRWEILNNLIADST